MDTAPGWSVGLFAAGRCAVERAGLWPATGELQLCTRSGSKLTRAVVGTYGEETAQDVQRAELLVNPKAGAAGLNDVAGNPKACRSPHVDAPSERGDIEEIWELALAGALKSDRR